MTAPTEQSRGRRPWIAAVAGAAVVLLIGGVTAGYVLYGKPSDAAKPTPTGPILDACAMVSQQEAERLVPDATVVRRSKNNADMIVFACTWENDEISHGEFWRRREISVEVVHHPGEAAETGRARAENFFRNGRSTKGYAATAPPRDPLKEGEKDYRSPLTELTDVGEGAYTQYTWRQKSTHMRYAFAEAAALTGDMTIAITYEASQQRKDAEAGDSSQAKSVTEENATREVTALLRQVAKGVTAWRAKNPGILAQPDTATTSSPSAEASATPTAIPTLPPACQAVIKDVTALVPGAQGQGERSEEDGRKVTACSWLNKDIPDGQGKKKIRSLTITAHVFSNRAGAEDRTAAKAYYAEELGMSKASAGSTMENVATGPVEQLANLGDAAFYQYNSIKTGPAHVGHGQIVAIGGAIVFDIRFAGSSLPADAAPNGPEVELMPDGEARTGVESVAKPFAEALK